MNHPEYRTRDYIWRCPCGLNAPFPKVLGHRRGHRDRPQCTGEIEYVGPAQGAVSPKAAAASEVPEAEEVDGRPRAFEYLGDLPPDDPEEIARQFNQQRSVGLEAPTNGHDGWQGDEAATLPEGDWRLEPPRGTPDVSQASITVRLPVKMQVYFDYFRAEGWHQGDGGISAWVTDFLLDHIEHCMGKAVVVVDREEVILAGRA